MLLHNTTIDADTLRRLIAAARRSGQTSRSEAETAAAEDMQTFHSGLPFPRRLPRQERVEVAMEALLHIAEAASSAADAARDTEPAWADDIRDDLHAVKAACDLAPVNTRSHSTLPGR